jgi:hypothetical protein
MRTSLMVAALVVTLGCGGGVEVFDAGAPAAEPLDAGASDAGIDAGPMEADAGSPDAGNSDAGNSDAGNSDAGNSDAGNSDAGNSDAGTLVPADAGVGFEDPGVMTSPARVITADGTSFVIDQVGDALDHVLTPTRRHVILYVHGRSCGGGGEPTKSLAGAVPEMESSYQAVVLMFTWPGSSSGCPLGFPEPEARASGTAFSHTLHKLAAAVHARGAAVADVTLTLVTHSLGNIVLEEALTHDTRPLPPSLFATALLSSSATALVGHRAWLTAMQCSAHLYVSVNDGDSVLTAAGIGRGTRLGKKLNSEPLAANALYVDFTAANVNHAYYLHSGQNGAHMGAFYDSVMEGRAYDFATSPALTRTDARDGTFVYVFDGL